MTKKSLVVRHVNESGLRENKETGFLYLPSTSIAVSRSTEGTEIGATTLIQTAIQGTITRETERYPLNTWLETKIDFSYDINTEDNELVPIISNSEKEHEKHAHIDFKNESYSSKKPRLASNIETTDDILPVNQNQQQRNGCPNCQVLIYHNDNENNLRIKCSQFNGTMMQRKSKCDCVLPDIMEQYNGKEKYKSDANLLIGAAILSSRLVETNIESIQIILHEKMCSNNNNHPCSLTLTSHDFYSASIIIVISQVKDKVKLPSTCTQFLYSMVQVDWNAHKEILSLGSSNNNNNKSKIMEDLLLSNSVLRNYFPKELSLHELYQRMNTASKQHKRQYQQNTSLEFSSNTEKASQQQQTSMIITSVPSEVLITYICSFLTSKSLHSLRCTCKYLFHVECSVIPGLKLKLYPHQTASLCWMRRREASANDKIALDQNKRDDCTTTPSSSSFISGSLIPFLKNKDMEQKSDKKIINQTDNIDKSFIADSCQGGLLCDDPGLGKTITVLSLILQTFGLSTDKNMEDEKKTSSITDDDKFDHLIFQAYWNDSPDFSREQILINVMKQLKILDTKYFLLHYSRSIINNQVLEKRISQDYYKSQFDNFQRDIDELLSYYDDMSDDVSYVDAFRQEAKNIRNHLKTIICEMKEEKVTTTKKSHYKTNRAKANSLVAPLIRSKLNSSLKSSLLPSKSTLIVVPSPLIQHWIEQIELHVDFSYCSKDNEKDNSVPVYHYDYRRSGFSGQDPANVKSFVESHNPLVFVDYGNCHPLPDPEILCQFSIVITTNQRLTNEWKNGNLEDEYRPVRYTWEYAHRSTIATTIACPLLKIQWLRLVVDEGHTMGRSRANAIIFGSWINAQRRWVMTGTPTPNTNSSSQSGLKSIFGLIHFLKQNPVDKDCFQSFICQPWNEGLLVSFIRLHYMLSRIMIRHTKLDVVLPRPELRTTLVDMSPNEILSYNTIVSTTRMNILLTGMESNTSGFVDSLLNPRNFSAAREAVSNIRKICCGGNDIVVWLHPDMVIDEEEEQEENANNNEDNEDDTEDRILQQRKKPNKYKIERMQMKQMFKSISNLQDVEIKVVENYMYRTTIHQQKTGCMSCGHQLLILMITPCGHMVCVECFNSKTKICPVCNKKFDADDCQLLQPGFKPLWKSHLEQQPVQPVTEQNNEDNSQVAESSPTHNFIVQNPPSPRVVRRRINKKKPHQCIYPSSFVDGMCELCGEEHDCDFRFHSKCPVCHRLVEDCPPVESKFCILIKKVNILLTRYHQITQYRHRRLFVTESSPFIKKEDEDTASPNTSTVNCSQYPLSSSSYSSLASPIITKQEHEAISNTSPIGSSSKRALKIIVFSQFRDTLNLVGHRLIRRFGRACIAEFFGAVRNIELNKFIYSPTCFCMLLTKDGSHGLDLSFVTNIFFMEPVLDQALESQVVSRAYRMGAKEKVVVDKLIAKSSVEESILALNSKNDDQAQKCRIVNDNENCSKKTTKSEKEVHQARIHHLLMHIRLIRDDPITQRSDSTSIINDSSKVGGCRKRVLFDV